MRALRVRGRSIQLEDVPLPDDSAGHVGQAMAVVRVALAGVCNTDLEIVQGYMGFEGTLGHEFVGHVEAGPDVWRDQRVVAEINYACGSCARCDAGLGRHCDSRLVMGIQGVDGAFAERIRVPVANLHRVPEGITNEAAVLTEPLAAAFEILEQSAVERGQRYIVFGDGKLGSLVARVLAHAGADVTCVGKHTDKLAALAGPGLRCFELERWRRAGEPQAALVIDATGSAEGLQLALAATQPRGRLVLKSTVAGDVRVDLAPLVIHEIELLGSRCGLFPPALEALAAGSIDVSSLIEDRVALTRGSEALAAASRRGARKILIDCES